MNNLFKQTSANWVHYSKYEYRETSDGTLYITPCKDALQKQNTKEELQQKVLEFVNNYGLLGLMTALPTTPEFITYEAVYFPKNHFIKEECLSTEEYLSYFFPFEEIDFRKKGMECLGGITATYRIALLDKPTIIWEFHSLLLAIQMMFSFMLTDETSTLKLCKHCGKIFVGSRPNVQFCTPQCKNQYNVYKSRAKKDEE